MKKTFLILLILLLSPIIIIISAISIEKLIPEKSVNTIKNPVLTTSFTNYIYDNKICDGINIIETVPYVTYKPSRIRVSCFKNRGALKDDQWVFFNADTGEYIEYMASGVLLPHPIESMIYTLFQFFTGQIRVE